AYQSGLDLAGPGPVAGRGGLRWRGRWPGRRWRRRRWLGRAPGAGARHRRPRRPELQRFGLRRVAEGQERVQRGDRDPGVERRDGLRQQPHPARRPGVRPRVRRRVPHDRRGQRDRPAVPRHQLRHRGLRGRAQERGEPGLQGAGGQLPRRRGRGPHDPGEDAVHHPGRQGRRLSRRAGVRAYRQVPGRLRGRRGVRVFGLRGARAVRRVDARRVQRPGEGQGDLAAADQRRRRHHLPRLRRHGRWPLRRGQGAESLRHRRGLRPGQAGPRRPHPDLGRQARGQRGLPGHQRRQRRQLPRRRGHRPRPEGEGPEPGAVPPLRRRRAAERQGRGGQRPEGHHKRRHQGPRRAAAV
ncbi:MAG: Nucleoside ABC transporter, periplasmic nucleoside-binding protein, partial [uncultured Rubrobacteraceae bacterium]